MLLKSARTRKELAPVLLEASIAGAEISPDPVYLVFSLEDKSSEWVNATIIANGLLGREFPKTFGHYHPENSPDETYKVIHGEGAFLLQQKYYENGAWAQDKVKDVVIVKVEKGDEILISADWGHSSSNLGTSPLVTLDTWSKGHTPQDYEIIKNLHGMAYYLVKNGKEPEFVKNPNYLELPAPKIMSASEFVAYQKKKL